MKKITLLILIIFFSLSTITYADDNLKAFKQVVSIKIPQLKVPTVVETDISNLHSNSFVVWDDTRKKFVPSKVFQEKNQTINLSANINNSTNASALVDNNLNTFFSFDTDGFSMSQTEITLDIQPINFLDGIELVLNKNVALPNFVMIKDSANNKTIVARKALSSRTIHFPQTKTTQIKIILEHIQPLQIAEIKILHKISNNKKVLRFLAQPQSQYHLYLNAAYNPEINFSEFPDLSDNEDIKRATLSTVYSNSAFQEPDIDNDGVIDKNDNCVDIANPDQKDDNNNGRGDVCDDFDKDGVINIKDNCPNNPNRFQQDKDKDGKGDVCDTEESRFTERNPWLVWVAIALVTAMLIGMSLYIVKHKKEK